MAYLALDLQHLQLEHRVLANAAAASLAACRCFAASPSRGAPRFKGLSRAGNRGGGLCEAGGNTVFVVHPFQRDFVVSDLPFITTLPVIERRGRAHKKKEEGTLKSLCCSAFPRVGSGTGGACLVCSKMGVPCPISQSWQLRLVGVSSFPAVGLGCVGGGILSV